MTTATVIRSRPGPRQPAHRTGFGRLVRAEWTKIGSVRSTVWSLGILVVSAIGLNTFITAAGMAGWNSLSAATRQGYLADPTGFLAAALNIAQIPVCVLGAMVITSEYSTGMIRASVLAVPRRTPMLAAKAAVFAAVAFAAGTLVAFASFLSAQAIIRSHIPVSLSDPAVLRAVFGMGLYLTVLGLLGLAIGELLANVAKHSRARHAAIEAVQLPGLLRLRVTDDGTGDARLNDGGGLAGLASRVRTVDGRLEISSPHGGPTVVTIEMPSGT